MRVQQIGEDVNITMTADEAAAVLTDLQDGGDLSAASSNLAHLLDEELEVEVDDEDEDDSEDDEDG